MDRDTEKILANELLNIYGWKNLVVPYMEEKIRASTERLITVEPDNIESIVKYQTTIKMFKEFLNYIQNLTK